MAYLNKRVRNEQRYHEWYYSAHDYSIKNPDPFERRIVIEGCYVDHQVTLMELRSAVVDISMNCSKVTEFTILEGYVGGGGIDPIKARYPNWISDISNAMRLNQIIKKLTYNPYYYYEYKSSACPLLDALKDNIGVEELILPAALEKNELEMLVNLLRVNKTIQKLSIKLSSNLSIKSLAEVIKVRGLESLNVDLTLTDDNSRGLWGLLAHNAINKLSFEGSCIGIECFNQFIELFSEDLIRSTSISARFKNADSEILNHKIQFNRVITDFIKRNNILENLSLIVVPNNASDRFMAGGAANLTFDKDEVAVAMKYNTCLTSLQLEYFDNKMPYTRTSCDAQDVRYETVVNQKIHNARESLITLFMILQNPSIACLAQLPIEVVMIILNKIDLDDAVSKMMFNSTKTFEPKPTMPDEHNDSLSSPGRCRLC